MWQCDPPASLVQLEGILRHILDVQRAQLDVQQAHLAAVQAQQQHYARSRVEIQAVGERALEAAPASSPKAGVGSDSPRPGDERIPMAPDGAEESSALSSTAAAKGASGPEEETAPLAHGVPQRQSFFDDEVVESSRAPHAESPMVRNESTNYKSLELVENLNIMDRRIPIAPEGAEESSAPSSTAAAKGASRPEEETAPLAHGVPQGQSLFDDKVVEPSRAPHAEPPVVRRESLNGKKSAIMENLNIINAYKALSKAVWYTNERPDAEVYIKLKGVPRSVRRLMFFTGVFPVKSYSGKTGFYSMYVRVLQYIVWAIAVAWTAQWSIEAYFNRDGARSLSGVHFPVFCFFCEVATAPYMMFWRSEFGNGSQTLAVLCSLDDVPWSELDAPTGVTVLMVLFYSATVIGVRVRYTLSVCDADIAKWADEATAMDLLLLSTGFIGLPALLWWIATLFGLAWLTTFGSKLHCFDLLKYATTLEGAIVSDEAGPDLLEVIKKYEATVTTRLRHASRGWVRYGLFLFALNTVAGLVICSYLVGDQQSTGEKVACFFVLTAILAWNSMVSRSFMQVAETFEYDVLRSLNNPVVLSRVQKYMGQQFLNHLKCLDWGFRVGGTVISTRLSMQLSIPLVAGSLSAAAKLMLDKE